jgi:hypothetical protein
MRLAARSQASSDGTGTRPSKAGSGPNLNVNCLFLKKGEIEMDNTMIIRIVAGVLFVIVLVVLIQRRRTRVK